MRAAVAHTFLELRDLYHNEHAERDHKHEFKEEAHGVNFVVVEVIERRVE